MHLGSQSRVLVLHRSPSPVPSIQMYIAWTLSPWGSSMYWCLTALLKLALDDVAIFLSYYKTPEDKRRRAGIWVLAALRITCWPEVRGRKKTKRQNWLHCFFFQKGEWVKNKHGTSRVFSYLSTLGKKENFHCLRIICILTTLTVFSQRVVKGTHTLQLNTSLHYIALAADCCSHGDTSRLPVKQYYIICFLVISHMEVTIKPPETHTGARLNPFKAPSSQSHSSHSFSLSEQ